MGRRLQISQIDTLFADGSYPIEFLLFFDRAFDVDRLRPALKRLRRTFWPVFGIYRDGVIADEGQRADEFLVVEQLDQELPPSDDDAQAFEHFRRLSIGPTDHLFALRVVRFRNGLALVPRLSHLAGDGYSYFYLLSVLAGLTRLPKSPLRPIRSHTLPLLYRPHHRRAVQRGFEYSDRETVPIPEDRADYSVVSRQIPKSELRAVLKDLSASHGQHVSTNDYLSAVALKHLVSSNREQFGDRIDLTIPIDVRRNVTEYGRRFFGNAIMLHTWSFETDRIERASEAEIALAVREGFPEVSRETYLEYLIGLEHQMEVADRPRLQPYDPERGCLVTNLSRLPTERLDFGTGPPRLVTNITAGRNGAVILSRGKNLVLRMVC